MNRKGSPFLLGGIALVVVIMVYKMRYSVLYYVSENSEYLQAQPVKEQIYNMVKPDTLLQPSAHVHTDGIKFPDGIQVIDLNPQVSPVNYDDTVAVAEEKFYSMAEKVHLKCKDIVRLGRVADGGWDMCVVGPYAPTKPCLVYSFGINNIWDFDDAVSKKYGCQVRSFDPSMKDNDHNRTELISFYKTGLDGTNQKALNGWKMRTLKQLMQELGDTDKTIDMLKMDVEYSEWDAFEAMLYDGSLNRVKQLAMEIHTHDHPAVRGGDRSETSDYARYWRHLRKLETLGFYKYQVHVNAAGYVVSPWTKYKRTCCYDIYYLNTNFLK